MLSVLLLAGTVLWSANLPFHEFLHRLETLPVDQRAHNVEQYLAGRRLPLIDADTLLTFVWYGTADSVFVNGSLQDGWRKPVRMDRLLCTTAPRGASLFYKQYTVPRDAHLEYQFKVDTLYMLDPGNVRVTPNGDFSNSEAVMPGFQPTRWTAYRPAVSHGRLDTLLFTPRDTTLLPRRIFVYVPPGEKLASIYVHDGETALRYMFVTTILDNMLAEKELPPVLAVFVPSIERGEEYVGRKLIRYTNALADELVPMIEKRYGTAQSPALRGTMGISFGGDMALAAGLLRPDVFGACAGQSSGISPLLSALVDVRKRSAQLPREFALYLQVGRFDIITEEGSLFEMNRQFHRDLSGLHIRHLYVESNDGHDWPSWRERVPDILRFFFKPQ
jgi:enterochelin esterase family protein